MSQNYKSHLDFELYAGIRGVQNFLKKIAWDQRANFTWQWLILHLTSYKKKPSRALRDRLPRDGRLTAWDDADG